MERKPTVIVFARAPVPGETKTRLIPALGPQGAAELYRCFLLDTLSQAALLPWHVTVAASGAKQLPEVRALVAQACPRAEVTLQRGANLGARMHHALQDALAIGRPSAVIVGTDLPTLPPDRITRALERLDRCELVLGPCLDGGYYLIGLRRPLPELFRTIEWGGPTVLVDTLRLARELGRSVSLLEPWFDVDTPADLEMLRSQLTALNLAGETIPCPRTWEYLSRQSCCFGPPWRTAEAPVPHARGPGRSKLLPHRPDSPITVIIPALNEEASIGAVVDAIPSGLDCDVLVVDNGSTDRTAATAAAHGARVVSQPERGYGAACLAGLGALDDPEVVVFLDADFSDDPSRLRDLVQPVLKGEADLVIGSRMLGRREPGAMPLHTVFGNWLAGRILTLLYRQPATDLGPFRAIRHSALKQLQMSDRGYGWTMEMQAKAARLRLRTLEIPVPYRKRLGRSKISGAVWPSIQAAAVILRTAFRLLWWRGPG